MLAQLAAQRQKERAKWEGGYAWLSLIGVAQEIEAGRDTNVRTIGFVARREGQGEDEFLAVRFVMQCCAACATPVAVPVRWAEAKTLEENQWVEVFGKVDPETKRVGAEEVRPIEPPDNPYL
jgi:uncharacterized repeat protein (TIGR03943 family)